MDQYKAWTRVAIRSLFPHEMLSSGYGRLHAGGVSPDYAIAIDHPPSYLRCIRNRVGGIDSPILRACLATREPQLFESHDPWPHVPEAWFECFREHDMRNVASHGKVDLVRCVATYHSFYRIPGRLRSVHAEVLRRLVPVMHEVLCGVMELLQAEINPDNAFAGLSLREKEIVRWVGMGKTNREVAMLADLSENTVKHHLTSIFAKLGIGTRTQLMCRLAERDAKTAAEIGPRVL